MSVLDPIPAVVRVLFVFFIMLLAIRKKISLGSGFVGGSIALGLIFGLDFGSLAAAALHALTHPKTVSLAAIVTLILVLSHSMEAAGQMQRLLDAFQGLIRHAGLNIALFPALIGLLPMPGGAIFSAPMVKNIGGRRGLSGDLLSYVNYWFRHIWEYWWPLYPGVLLITAMTGLDLWVFVLFSLPLTAVAVTAGYLPLGRALPSTPLETFQNDRASQRRRFFRELLPIVLVIVGGLGLGTLLSLLLSSTAAGVAKEIGLIVALLAAIAQVWHANRLSPAARWRILRNPKLLELAYMVMAILVFQEVLSASGAVDRISEEFIAWRIPVTLIAVLLPMLVGYVAGITIAFVATTFPILISLIDAFGFGHLLLPYMMLGLASGFVGVLLSPVHLCLLLSNAYFETSLVRVYRLILFPCAALLAAGGIYFELAARFLSRG